MREFEVSITNDMLKTGLRPNYRNPRNLFRWVTCQNVICEETGLGTFNQIPFFVTADKLIKAGIDGWNWPNPQLFIGDRNAILTYGNRLFFVDSSTGKLLEMNDIRDTENVNSQVIPNTGGIWQFADMQDCWIMVNGSCAVMFFRKENITSGEDYIRCSNSVQIETITQWNGRTIIGGLEKIWHDDIVSYMNSHAGVSLSGFNTDMSSINEEYIMWSNVGVSLWWLFFPDLWKTGYVSAGYSETSRPFLFELMLRGDLGWMNAGVGRVLQVKNLGERLVVYGTRGIRILAPTIDPVPTLVNVGNVIKLAINNKGSVGGDNNKHLFLTDSGTLWELSSQSLRKLDYQEYFIDELDLDWIINYDLEEDHFYICSGKDSYVLTAKGLSSVKQLVSSVYRVGQLYCQGTELLDHSMLLITDEFDNNRNEIDSIQWIKILGNNLEHYQVAIDYKFSVNDEWTRSSFVSLNSEGTAYLNIAGVSFRIVLKVDQEDMVDDSDFEPPDSLVYTFKNNDKRYTRGINVGKL